MGTFDPSAEIAALEREIATDAQTLVFLARALALHAQRAGMPLDMAKASADFAACLDRIAAAQARLAELAKTPAEPQAFPEFTAP